MTALCDLIVHENGVREMRLHDSTRQAVDELTVHMSSVMASWQPEQDGRQVYLLVDMRDSGLPPLNYMMQKVREWISNYRHIMRQVYIREALLVPINSGIVLSLAGTFARMLPVDSDVKFFSPDEYEDAIAWLLQQDS